MTTASSSRYNGIFIDPLGFLHIEGVRICRVLNENGATHLQFFDKDRRRSSCRGSCYVSVRIDQLLLEIKGNGVQDGASGNNHIGNSTHSVGDIPDSDNT